MDVWARFLRKKALEGQIPRGSFRDREVFHGRANLVPKVFLADAGFGGKSHHRHARVLLAEAAHRPRQVIARHAVTLGRDDGMRTAPGSQKFQQLAVTLLRGNVGIDERKTEGESGTLLQVRIDEAGPVLGDFARDFRVAITGQVGEQKLGLGLASAADFIKVDGAGAAGSIAGPSEFFVYERIDDG